MAVRTLQFCSAIVRLGVQLEAFKTGLNFSEVVQSFLKIIYATKFAAKSNVAEFRHMGISHTAWARSQYILPLWIGLAAFIFIYCGLGVISNVSFGEFLECSKVNIFFLVFSLTVSIIYMSSSSSQFTLYVWYLIVDDPPLSGLLGAVLGLYCLSGR